MQKEVLGNMKNFYHFIDVSFDINFKLPETLSQDQIDATVSFVKSAFVEHKKQLNNFVNEILLERGQLEIEFYKLKHNSKI